MTKTLEQLEVGDKVWVGSVTLPRQDVRTVAKLTPAQIVLDNDDRYRRDNRRGIGVTFRPRITAVATAEDVVRWQAERAEATRAAEERRRRLDEREARRRELCDLFGDSAVVDVSDGQRPGEWMVTVYGSEDNVQRLAEMLKAVPPPTP